MEIVSPGGFYRGEKIGKTYDLSGVTSNRRNKHIFNVLVACNVMEVAGTGVEKSWKSMPRQMMRANRIYS